MNDRGVEDVARSVMDALIDAALSEVRDPSRAAKPSPRKTRTGAKALPARRRRHDE